MENKKIVETTIGVFAAERVIINRKLIYLINADRYVKTGVSEETKQDVFAWQNIGTKTINFDVLLIMDETPEMYEDILAEQQQENLRLHKEELERAQQIAEQRAPPEEFQAPPGMKYTDKDLKKLREMIRRGKE